MTGMEEIKKKLIEHGATRMQTDSKIVELLIAVLGEESDSSKDLIEKTYLELKKELSDKIVLNQEAYCQYIEKKEQLFSELNEEKRNLSEEKDRFQNEKTAFLLEKQELEQMMAMETPEARDQIRKMLFFRKTIQPDSPGERIAYVTALGHILSAVPGIPPFPRPLKD